MPVYNSESTIEETIASLKQQTFSNIEIICVNDGSTDKSRDILEKNALNDDRIKIINQVNSGPAAARNAALKVASGEYLMFCDSDDTYEPNMCKRMLETIEQEHVDLVMCDTKINVTSKNLRTRYASRLDYNKLNMFGKIRLDNENRQNVRVTLWNKIFKKEIVDKNNITFPILYTTEDDAFTLIYITLIENAYGLNEQLYNYNVRGDSLTDTALHKDSKNMMDIFHSLYFVFEYLHTRNILQKNIIWLLFVLNKCMYMKLNIAGKDKYREIFELTKNILKFVSTDTISNTSYKLLIYIKQDDYKKYNSFIKNQGAETPAQKLFSLKNFGNKKVLKILGIGFSFDRG